MGNSLGGRKAKPSIDDLPDEVVAEILQLLPIRSIAICSCVSKSWNSLILQRSFIHSFKLRMEKSLYGAYDSEAFMEVINKFSEPRKQTALRKAMDKFMETIKQKKKPVKMVLQKVVIGSKEDAEKMERDLQRIRVLDEFGYLVQSVYRKLRKS